MTVKELIEHLQKCDPQAEVIIEVAHRTDSYADPIGSIRNPKDETKEVWLCGFDGFAPEFRESVGFNILFEETL